MTANSPQSYTPGSIYTFHGHDWMLSKGAIEDGINLSATPLLVQLCTDYSIWDEAAQDSGIFEYLLSCVIFHFTQWKKERVRAHPTAKNLSIWVEALPRPSAIMLGATTLNDLEAALGFLSDFFHNPQPATGQSPDANFYSGIAWHNDAVLRTGLTSIAVRPLDIEHAPDERDRKMRALAQEISPHNGDRTHLFITNAPELIGRIFTTPPRHMTEEAFLRSVEQRPPAYEDAGCLETDDPRPLLSMSATISPEAFIAYGIISGFLNAMIEKIAGSRAQVRTSQGLRNRQIIVSYGLEGDWLDIDAHELVCALLGTDNEVDSRGIDAELSDSRIEEIIEVNGLHEYWEGQLWLHHIAYSQIRTEDVREALREFLSHLHIPARIATGNLVNDFPPLTPMRGWLVSYGGGQGAVNPPPIDAEDLQRDFLEPAGEHFWTGLLFHDVDSVQSAPHRLTIGPEEIVAEWFSEHTPNSALIRRQALAWEELMVWASVGEGLVLIDSAGRFFDLLPDLFPDAERIWELLAAKREQCREAGAMITRGRWEKMRGHMRRLLQAKNYGESTGAMIPAPWGGGRVAQVALNSDHMRENSAPRSNNLSRTAGKNAAASQGGGRKLGLKDWLPILLLAYLALWLGWRISSQLSGTTGGWGLSVKDEVIAAFAHFDTWRCGFGWGS